MKNLLVIFAIACSAAAAAPQPAELPPLPPPAPSPIEKFRAWLGMAEGEREAALAAYPADKQKILREKIRAYQILPSSQRDRRLDMLELRWYLRPLMSLPPAQREPHLRMVPPPLQPMVLDRLQAWDRLDANTRRELLASEDRRELVMAYFAQIRRGVPQSAILGQMPEQKRAELQQALAAWNRTSSAEAERRSARLATFFETRPEAQARTLAVLSPAEQADIQRTLDAFAQLPLAQRRACVNSFQKFAAMTPEQRGEFLRNAARWREMTPRERALWKELVGNLPPMPPEPDEPKPMPPLPNAPAASAGDRWFANNNDAKTLEAFHKR